VARRWIRLLFGREFAFDQLLVLWDTLFAYDPTLELMDLICVAMLLRIRWTCKAIIPCTSTPWASLTR
jgi:TBC1 domain family protein 5